MKTKITLIVLLAALSGGALFLAAQAVFPYVLTNAGITFSDSRGFISLVDDAPDNSRFVAVSGPNGALTVTSGGITPYYVWTNGLVGQTQHVPYTRGDGSQGTLLFSGGVFVGTLDGIQTGGPRDEFARGITESLRRRSLLR